MRLRLRHIVLAAIALSGATPALAAKGDNSIGLQFGGSAPTGDFGNYAKTGFQGGLTWTHFESGQAGVGLDVAYHTWGSSDVTIALFPGFLGPTWQFRSSAIQTTAHVLYDIPTGGKATPYAQGGIGFYWLRTMLDTQVGSLGGWEEYFGYNLGTGVNFDVGPMFDIGVGGTYHIIVQPGGPDATFFTVGMNLMWGMGGK